MHTIQNSFDPSDYCGTTQAAKMVGLSVGTVQTLVEKGEIEAFKTMGGHRRVSLKSIRDFMAKRGLPLAPAASPKRLLRIMVIDDDALTQEIIRTQINSMDHPVDVFTYGSAIQALLDMTAIEPDVLITDLRMPGINGRELLASVRANDKLRNCLCVAMSAMSAKELEEDGGQPQGVVYVSKPLSATWIGGFLSAVCA